MKCKARKRQRRSGLTLLELMIVLIILVGLLALVGPRLLGSQRKADIKTAQAQIANIEQALKMYVVDMKTYPSTEEGLQVLFVAPDDERRARNWDGPYMDGDGVPLDPWGNEFGYEYGSGEEGSSGKPRIISSGPDSESGTEDDIANRKAAGEEGSDGDGGMDSFDSDSGSSDDIF